MGKKIDLTGQVYGRLTAVRENGRSKDGQVLWLCKCSCPLGNEVTVSCASLRNGHTKSCGCLSRETHAEICTKHGLYVSHPRLYKAIATHFREIKKPIRCYEGWQIDPRYTLDSTGAVKFCEDLIASRPEECERYERDKSLDIDKDNDRNRIFRPESIVFVSRTENILNRRNTLRLSDGTSLATFCTKVGIQTCKNGEGTKQYRRIREAYSRRHKAHPELLAKANDLISLYQKTLALLKLREEVRQLKADVETLSQMSR
jgi:hypothetical protein